ncbi:MAG: cold shock and DUF1294 domain-containing protein [Dokdonella sp.]
MRQQGRISSWNDDKGFGFITRNGDGPITFLHIRAFSNRQRRPAVNALVTYDIGRDTKGRPRALDVRFVGAPVVRSSASSPSNMALACAVVFIAVIGALAITARMPIALLAWYLFLSVITFFLYGLDKAAARTNRWRTQEKTLHLFALFGGWPGAAAAQRLLRHKNRKQSFLITFALTVAANCGALAWLLSPYGERALHMFSHWGR